LPDYSTFADAELKSHGNRVCMINSPYESERAIRYHIKLTSELLRRQPFILAENDKSIFPQVLSEPMIQADVKTSDKKSKSKPRKTETEKPNPYDMSIDSVLQQDVCAVSRADAEKTAPFVVIHDSPYNPPSGNRRMRGEMLYLSANFPDGQHVCVTCCVDGFFANRSTQQRFDPSPVQQGGVFATLMELLLQTNQSFRDRYTKAAANASTVYLMEYFSIPEAHRGPAWLTSSFRLPDDAADASRAEVCC
jgi:protein TIF31